MAELDVLVPEDSTVTTIKGETITLTPLSWGREVKILRIIKDIMGKLGDSHVFDIELETDENGVTKVKEGQAQELVGRITEVLLDTATDSLTAAVAAIVGKDDKWVEDNLDAERILDILVPFLRSKRDSIGMVLQKYLPGPTTPTAE